MSRLLLVIMLVSSVSAQCPAKCSCSVDNTRVDCSKEDLTRLPADPFNDAVVKLDLSGNRIPVLKNNSFEDLRIYNLEILVISNMKTLSDIEVDAFRSLGRVVHLDLSGNDIAEIKPEVFRHVNKLQTLILDNNPLVLLQDGFTLKSLHTLSLIQCTLSRIPENFFGNMPELKELKLSQNNLNSFDSRLVRKLNFLKSLDISNNKLTNPLEVIYELPESIEDLYLSKNEWLCDCELKNINASYGKRFSAQEFMCFAPPELKNHVITDDFISKIVCTTTTSTMATTEEAGDDEVENAGDNQEKAQEDEPQKSAKIVALLPPSRVDNRHRPAMAPQPEVVKQTGATKMEVMNAGVVTEVDAGWASRNQWWMIGGASLLVVMCVLLALRRQVSRLARNDSWRGEQDGELEKL